VKVKPSPHSAKSVSHIVM